MSDQIKDNTSCLKKEWLHLLIAVIVFLINILYLNRMYGYFVLDDELGYWSHAANMAGYDWSGITGKMQWYSYGYSIVLFLIIQLNRLFGGNFIIAYRLAIAVNALFCSSIYIMCYHVAKKVTKHDCLSVISAIVSTLSCVLLFHSRIAWTECYIALITTAIAAITIWDINRNKIWLNILLGFLVGYIYIVHNRNLGIVIAYLVYALLMSVNKNKRAITTVSLLFPLLILLIDGHISNVLKIKMWGTTSNPIDTNNASNRLLLLANVFSVQGIMAAIRTAIGQLWYLGTSSFGLFYLGIFYMFTKIKYYFKMGEVNAALSCSFVLVAFVFTLGISVSSFFQFYIPDSIVNRADIYFYGRYIEAWLPLFTTLGCLQLYSLWDNKKYAFKLLITICFFHFIASISICSVPNINNMVANWICVSGVAALSNILTSKLSYVALILLFYTFLFVLSLCSWCAHNSEKHKAVFYAPLVCLIALSIVSSTKLVDIYINNYQNDIAQLVLGTDQVEDQNIGDNKTLVGIVNNNVPTDKISVTVKRIQFLNPSMKCILASADAIKQYTQNGVEYILLNFDDRVNYSEEFEKSYQEEFADSLDYIVCKYVTNDIGRGIKIPISKFKVMNGTIESDAIYSNDNSSFTMYGPYITLLAGTYNLIIEGELIDSVYTDDCFVDVTTNMGHKQIIKCDHLEKYVDGNNYHIECSFTLDAVSENCEFRMFTTDMVKVRIHCVSIDTVD